MDYKLIPSVDPADLKKMWISGKQMAQTGEPDTDPSIAEIKNIDSGDRRLTMLLALRMHDIFDLPLIELNGTIAEALPRLLEEQPSDAMFKAIAAIPRIDIILQHKIGNPYVGCPFDTKELDRLVKEQES